VTEEELRILAWTILGEAAGEGAAGMQAVAHVIRNRALSGRFPANPASVALQSNASGIHQFSTWNALSQGGNIPRAKYPVDSESFQRAYGIAQKVFGAQPGKDPTQGATHYYSPKGMPGGAAPYWWRSEAPKGEKRIGGHIFAIKRPDAVAPTPATRSVDPVGNFPSKNQLTVLRSGSAMQLPVIGPEGGPGLKSGKSAPTPAKQSLGLQIEREGSGGLDKPGQVVAVYDPVTKTFVKPLPSAGDVMRAAPSVANIPQSYIERMPAKAVQRVAGFSVPGGIEGIKQVDAARAAPKVSVSDKVRAAKVPPKATQTTFAPPVAQPAGSVNDNKDTTQLGAGTNLEPKLRVESGGLSRDAVAARAAGVAATTVVPAAKLPPMPIARPQRPPVTVVTPPPPLRIVVQRDPVAETIRTATPKSEFYTDPIAFGNKAVSQSGDTSSGSQADAAAARASGNAWRESQSAKRK
jgi:hypothetical protein